MQNSNTNPSLKRNYSQLSEEYGSFKIIHTDDDTNSLNSQKRKIISEYKISYNETKQSNRHKTPSGVWKFFALATKHFSSEDGNNQSKDEADDRVLCMLCYAKGQVHVYKSKTSSSNLWRHLNRKHDIEIPTEKMFAVCSSSFDKFELDDGNGNNSNDYQSLNVLDNESGNVLVKAEDFDGIEEYTEEEEEDADVELNVQSDILLEEDEQNIESIFMEKDIGLLIVEEVAKRPILYDVAQSNKISAVRATKEVLWAEIYEAIGQVIPIERIQKIWKSIRDRYRKIRNMEREGMECLGKYKYYDHLSFLDEAGELGNQVADRQFEDTSLSQKKDFSFLIEQNDSSMLPSVDDLVQSDQNYTTEDVVSEACVVSSSNPPTVTATIYPMNGPHSNNSEAPAKQPSPSPGPPQQTAPNDVVVVANKNTTAPVDDEFDLFGKLIANKLRNAPRDRVNLIEVKIMQAILENT